MILENTTTEKAVLSNVGEVVDFSMKATAKSFRIMSSTLYSNKIRAMIREISCNAFDSHVAAGKKDVPFDVHLPNSMEPWFSVRDYGIGLDHSEVTKIYTTFFESTKNDSNDFVGGLGLGSKSPFCYTNNFTITAIKNGRKGVYTAFINDTGIPSLALMTEEQTTEANGVEVFVAIDDENDYYKFRMEAQSVYRTFATKPIVSGSDRYMVDVWEYDMKDIIPGVSSHNGSGHIMVMGNVGYPVSTHELLKYIPAHLENLIYHTTFEMYFEIGELDFQPSREGLSFIPLTINAIVTKLEQVHAALNLRFAEKVNAIQSNWEKAEYINNKSRAPMWREPIKKYIQDTKFDLVDNYRGNLGGTEYVRISDSELEAMNISLKRFHGIANGGNVGKVSYQKTVDGETKLVYGHAFSINTDNLFVINDVTQSAIARVKQHCVNNNIRKVITILSPINKTKPMDTVAFFDRIKNPDFTGYLINASDMAVPVKEKTEKEKSNSLVVSLNVNDEDYLWKEHRFSEFDSSTTKYYVPVKGFTGLGKFKDIKEQASLLKKVRAIIPVSRIYAVRADNMEAVKADLSWVNLDEYIESTLKAFGSKQIMSLVKQHIDFKTIYRHNCIQYVEDNTAEYYSLYDEFKSVSNDVVVDTFWLKKLFNEYSMTDDTANNVINDGIKKYQEKVEKLNEKYPLLNYIERYTPAKVVADYINMIDKQQ